jgi:hypothetical protein
LPIWLAMVASTVASQAISNPELRVVVAIAASVMLGPGGNFALVSGQGAGAAMANAAIAGFSSGMIASGGDPNAAFRGALTAMMFAQVGASTSAAGDVAKVAAHAAAGCVSSVAQGGKCGHGAVSQAISKAFTISTENWDMNIVEGTAANALVGGVSSKIVGGDFDKAAVTAAFGYLFNQMSRFRPFHLEQQLEGHGAGGAVVSNAAKGGEALTSRAARREAMRDADIPTSQQPVSQSRNASGREYSYDVPAPGGGTQRMSVQQQTMDRSHPGQAHWEAGRVKIDPRTGAVRENNYGRPALTNDKSKVDY